MRSSGRRLAHAVELRAEKPDDVLFGGSATASSRDHCEVELLFDNEDGGFGAELDYSEIAIARRLVRGGEGQYLVNRTPVRRTTSSSCSPTSASAARCTRS
jgi:chromosome segregation protein